MTDSRLHERPWKGINWLTLKEAGVTIDANGLVTIPYRRQDGAVFREQHATMAGRTYWGPGEGLLPFGLETLPPADEARRYALLVAEGVSDALAIRDAFADVRPGHPLAGFRSVALPGANTWKSDWSVYLEPHPIVYLVGDGDAAGRRMINAVHKDAPWSRPVWLPEGDDARSLLQRDGPRALDPLLDNANQVARLCVAFQRARTYDEFVQFLSGTIRHVAA